MARLDRERARMKRRDFLAAGAGLTGAAIWKRSVPSELTLASRDSQIDLSFLHNPGPDELSVSVTGDSILFRPHAEFEGPGFDELFQMQRECDVAITNCELVFSRSGYPQPKDVAFARPEIADEFVWQGIDLVSLANNHTMDLGPEALLETIAVLNERGIVSAGGGENLAAALGPGVVTQKDIRVGLLSFLCMSSPVAEQSTAKSDSPGLASIRGFRVRVSSGAGGAQRLIAPDDASLRAMEQAVSDARSQADVLIVAYHMHWGDRYEVNEGRKIIAHAAIDSGADVVFAHGPHVINPIEQYEGKLIFYSLGNFFFHIMKNNGPADIFGPTWPIRKIIYSFTTSTDFWEALCPRLIVGSDGIRKVQLLPLQITRDGNPRFPHQRLGRAIMEDVRDMSSGMGVDFALGDWHADLRI